MYMNLSTFLAFRNPVLIFLNFLISQALLPYEPRSYKKINLCFDLLFVDRFQSHINIVVTSLIFSSFSDIIFSYQPKFNGSLLKNTFSIFYMYVNPDNFSHFGILHGIELFLYLQFYLLDSFYCSESVVS